MERDNKRIDKTKFINKILDIVSEDSENHRATHKVHLMGNNIGLEVKIDENMNAFIVMFKTAVLQ